MSDNKSLLPVDCQRLHNRYGQDIRPLLVFRFLKKIDISPAFNLKKLKFGMESKDPCRNVHSEFQGHTWKLTAVSFQKFVFRSLFISFFDRRPLWPRPLTSETSYLARCRKTSAGVFTKKINSLSEKLRPARPWEVFGNPQKTNFRQLLRNQKSESFPVVDSCFPHQPPSPLQVSSKSG